MLREEQIIQSDWKVESEGNHGGRGWSQWPGSDVKSFECQAKEFGSYSLAVIESQ